MKIEKLFYDEITMTFMVVEIYHTMMTKKENDGYVVHTNITIFGTEGVNLYSWVMYAIKCVTSQLLL